MKHIGILGHSAEGSALCYITACRYGAELLGEHMHPDITLDVIAMAKSMPAWRQDDLATIKDILRTSADRLAATDSDFFVCPDNTAHIALENMNKPLPLPGLHIADIAAQEALNKGYGTVAVLGTNWTMEGPVYRKVFEAKGLTHIIPDEVDRHYIDSVIFDELCNGVFRDKARDRYCSIIRTLKDQGCDAVVLGCTEIPLLVGPEDSPLPTLDSTRLLARAAVDVALGTRDAPVWRGGPYCIDL